MKLVHDGTKVIMIFDAPDINLATNKTVFEGTFSECMAEIDRLNLTYEDIRDEEGNLIDEYDPYLIERVFKADVSNVNGSKMAIVPDNDVLPLDVLNGRVVKTDGDTVYMKCTINKESLESMIENSSSGELDTATVLELNIVNSYVGMSIADIPA